MRIAITGISGYLGTQIFSYLHNDTETEMIIGIDLKTPRLLLPKLIFHRMDVRDPRLSETLITYRPDIMIHLAFIVDFIRDFSKMHDININGTKNVLNACKKADIKRIIVTSSTTAYGAHPDNPPLLTEESPLRGNVNYLYARDKVEMDLLCQKFQMENPDTDVVILRPCIVMGPNVNNYISRFVKLPICITVKGADPPMQFIHEEDLVRGVVLVIKKRCSGIFNLVGKGTELLSELLRIAGSRVISLKPSTAYRIVDFLWKVRAPFVEAPSGMLDFIRYPWVASGEKMRERLGFLPFYSTREAFVSFLKKGQ